jgi:regulator of sigma E protease
VSVAVARATGHLTVSVRPYLDSVPAADKTWKKVGRIGIGLAAPIRVERVGLTEASVAGLRETVKGSTQIVRTVRGLFSGRISRREVGGPILIGQLAGQSVRLGVDVFLEFMALISVNLAVLNLLPVPVLDGGQFLFLLAEAVIRRPLPLKLRERLTAVGLVLIVLLMTLAFSNDIRRLFGG